MVVKKGIKVKQENYFILSPRIYVEFITEQRGKEQANTPYRY